MKMPVSQVFKMLAEEVVTEFAYTSLDYDELRAIQKQVSAYKSDFKVISKLHSCADVRQVRFFLVLEKNNEQFTQSSN